VSFVRHIKPNTQMGHQSSPAYVLTFIRWRSRDVLNLPVKTASDVKTILDTKRPLVVENDAIDINIKNSKVGLTPSLDITLKNGDIDYSAVLEPGDFVIVNLLEWESDARRVGNKARASQPINKYKDGFKGIFKIQTAGRSIIVQKNGSKKVTFNVQAFGFTEFNNIVYYDPVAASSLAGKEFYFWKNFGGYIDSAMNEKKKFSIQKIIQTLTQVLIGSGELQEKGKDISPNLHYHLPSLVGKLLGNSNAKIASQLYKYYLGVWETDGVFPRVKDSNKNGMKIAQPSDIKPSAIGKGFNPAFKTRTGESSNWFYTSKEIPGKRVVAPDYWNNVKVWGILKSYLNSVVNEMYTANRVGLDGSIHPSVIIRQKPFTSLEKQPQFKKDNIPTTTYLSLPRWKISGDLLYSAFLGKNEAARINFVQVYTQSVVMGKELNYAQQSSFNSIADKGDILRTGLRPFTASSNFNFPEQETKNVKKAASMWSRLVADWLFNGHLREVGGFEFHGIEEPIEVGDNLEFDGSVYHIESISHRFSIRGDGKKTFRTKISVSYGTSLKSNANKTVFPHTESTTYDQEQTRDYKEDKILPGISDTQDVVGRNKGIK